MPRWWPGLLVLFGEAVSDGPEHLALQCILGADMELLSIFAELLAVLDPCVAGGDGVIDDTQEGSSGVRRHGECDFDGIAHVSSTLQPPSSFAKDHPPTSVLEIWH